MLSTLSPMEENYFTNINHNQNVTNIIPNVELLVHFRTNSCSESKPCIIYSERLETRGLIQLRLAEKSDQRRMYISTIDSCSFQELKREQSLHVTYAGFIENLIRILQDCQTGKLQIHVVQQKFNFPHTDDASHSAEYQFQFQEKRPFKNLVYLCLPARVAPVNVVLFYISSLLTTFQRKTESQERDNKILHEELQMREQRIEQMAAESAQMRDSLLENIKTINQRHTEEIQKMQESLRRAAEQRHNENECSRKTISSLQQKIDKVTAEKSNILTEKVQEKKRADSLSQELSSAKGHISSLKEQNEKLSNDIASLRNEERKQEMHLNDARQQISELHDKLKKYDKSKADLLAELEAEKNISHTKRQALEMATEEISKANEIIFKQTNEISKLKKTVEWRTEVAVQQEKAIREKEKLIAVCEDEITKMQTINTDLQDEVKKQLQSISKYADVLEAKYTKKIKELEEKLALLDKENYPPFKNKRL